MVKNVNADDFSYTADGEEVEGVAATINDDGVLTGAKELGDVCDTTYVFLYLNNKSLWIQIYIIKATKLSPSSQVAGKIKRTPRKLIFVFN